MSTRLIVWTLLIVGCVTASAGGPRVPTTPRSRAATARVAPTLEQRLEARGLKLGEPIFIRIFKESRELEVWIESDGRFELFQTYPICKQSDRLGPKVRGGDLRSPEGFYFVTPSQLNPSSQFHLSFNLGYPNRYDRQHRRTGSALMVHGECVSAGCYAMTNEGIEEIYTLGEAALRNGQPFFRVHIFPFRMDPSGMARHRDSEWRDFWENLKEGHDFFEFHRTPPNVEVSGGRYVFEGS